MKASFAIPILTAILCSTAGFTGLDKPRIAPLPEDEWTEEHRSLSSPRSINIFKTIVRNPAAYSRWTDLTRYLISGSTIPPRHREMLMLRIGWLRQAEYEWAQHARVAKRVGFSEEELRAIAVGPGDPIWDDVESAVLSMADELRSDAFVSDATWHKLSARYTTPQLMDAVITVGQYNMVSMFLNSVGVQIDERAPDRFPKGVPLPEPLTPRGYTRPSEARVPLLEADQWTPEQRSLIEEVNSSGTVGNLYKTVIHHPKLFAPRWKFGSYALRDSGLPGRDREILIMRIAWLTRCEYEWAHHAPIALRNGMSGEEVIRIAEGAGAPGWSEFDATLLRAVDELHYDAFLTDATWKALATRYDDNQLMDVILTVGGYNMTGMLLNSFGVQLEDGYEGFPELE